MPQDTKILKALENIMGELQEVKRDVGEVKQQVFTLSTRLENIEVELQDVKHFAIRIATDLHDFKSETNERFDQIDKRFAQVDFGLDSMDARLDGMDARLDGMDARLDRIEVTMVTKDDLDKVLGEHQKDILAMLTIISNKIDGQDLRCLRRSNILNTKIYAHEIKLEELTEGLAL